MIRLLFGGNGRQTDSQTDSIDDGFMIPLLILPPLQTEANLQQAQAQSVHCQDPRGLVRSPAALQSQATVTHSSPALLLPRICSPCPPSLSFPSSFPFCLSLKMHPRVLMLPIKDSHNSDTVTNKPRSELPSRLQLIPPRRVSSIPGQLRGTLVSIKHPLAQHPVGGMLF